jgi:hypothetical protein
MGKRHHQFPVLHNILALMGEHVGRGFTPLLCHQPESKIYMSLLSLAICPYRDPHTKGMDGCLAAQEGRKTPPYVIPNRRSKTNTWHNTGNGGGTSFQLLLLFSSSSILRLMRIGQGSTLSLRVQALSSRPITKNSLIFL